MVFDGSSVRSELQQHVTDIKIFDLLRSSAVIYWEFVPQ